VLDISELSVGYGRVQVLFGVSLAVGRGECLAVLGPNGAGKTTLLATISGFLSPLAGHVRLDGTDIGGRAPHAIVRAGIAQVMQGRQVLGPMSVRDNLLLGAHLRLAREGRGAVEASLGHVYALFPILRERARLAAGGLSGGEQQMLAIGRALMGRPKLLLLDEPSMGLSPILVDQIFSIIREINQQGTTVLLVEQNALMALSVANRGYVLQTGEIVLADDADKLIANDMVRKAYLGEN
jgi:branched-chain amino acid transport system ATP-binding protein